MKIIISHGNTKREIKGPFRLCASPEMFRTIYDAIGREMDFGDLSCQHEGRGYGWIDIDDRAPSLENTEPIAWEAKGPT